MRDLYAILDKEVESLFPDDGKWYSSCYKQPKELAENNLPCHLRDNKWLAEYIMKKYKHYLAKKSDIMDYIYKSEKFAKLRHDYEQRIVSWQIDWMNSDGENWICEDDFFMFSTRCDIIFRKGIVDTLSAIGMDKEAIEEGIEKNSDKWLEKYMEHAFRNQYNSVFLDTYYSGEKLEEPSEEHYTMWRKFRLYNYYNKHKASIHKYGKVSSEMKMTWEEAEELQSWLSIEHNKRMKQIEEFKIRCSEKAVPIIDEVKLDTPDKTKTKKNDFFKLIRYW